ncbi:MAG TPA: hypothetical protein VF668_12795 [Pyrinomonadaceae bacterium]
MNYCNRCGGNLAPLTQFPAQESRAVVAPGAAWAAGLTTAAVIVIGLGLIFPITSELATRHVAMEALIAISLVLALAVVGCAAMLLRFWTLVLGVGGARRVGGAAAPSALPAPQAGETARELGGARPDALHPAPAHSVADQTTRTLEHVPKKS